MQRDLSNNQRFHRRHQSTLVECVGVCINFVSSLFYRNLYCGS